MTEQQTISDSLGVNRNFDAEQEATRRNDFLGTNLRASGLLTYVLGISGGVDSLGAALLAQRAVGQLRDSGYDARVIAVRLLFGIHVQVQFPAGGHSPLFAN